MIIWKWPDPGSPGVTGQKEEKIEKENEEEKEEKFLHMDGRDPHSNER